MSRPAEPVGKLGLLETKLDSTLLATHQNPKFKLEKMQNNIAVHMYSIIYDKCIYNA